jgi:hypothetical protein
MSRRVALLAALLLVPSAVVGLTQALGPGDPTTIFVSGFTNPCRTTFDSSGNLYVAELPLDTIYKVTPDGTRSFFAEVTDPRGIAFDVFGYLLVASREDSAVYRVSPQGQVSEFFSVLNSAGMTTGPDGDIWIGAVDSIHHFDAMGRHLESIDVRSNGAAAFGVAVSPAGELHMSSFASLHKLVNGLPVPVATDQPPQMRGFAFDALGNVVWAHRATLVDDVDRVILYDSNGTIVDDTLIAQVTEPCKAEFVRDTDGTMTNRLLIAGLDGVIREANAAGIAAIGWRTVGLEIGDITEATCADQIVGVTDDLDENHARFLDVIGNNNGSYDLGDFRAYLIATEVLSATTAATK